MRLTRTTTAGYALLELLAAFLLVSGGVIALLQTQLIGMTAEHELRARLHAVLLLNDLSRKLDALGKPLPSLTVGFASPPPASANCRRVFCDKHQLARFYLAHWKCRLGKWSQTSSCQTRFGVPSLLPDGDGQVRQLGNSVGITLRWQDREQQTQTLSVSYVPL